MYVSQYAIQNLWYSRTRRAQKPFPVLDGMVTPMICSGKWCFSKKFKKKESVTGVRHTTPQSYSPKACNCSMYINNTFSTPPMIIWGMQKRSLFFFVFRVLYSWFFMALIKESKVTHQQKFHSLGWDYLFLKEIIKSKIINFLNKVDRKNRGEIYIFKRFLNLMVWDFGNHLTENMLRAHSLYISFKKR